MQPYTRDRGGIWKSNVAQITCIEKPLTATCRKVAVWVQPLVDYWSQPDDFTLYSPHLYALCDSYIDASANQDVSLKFTYICHLTQNTFCLLRFPVLPNDLLAFTSGNLVEDEDVVALFTRLPILYPGCRRDRCCCDYVKG
jgi:hypothetical protein